MLPIHRISRKLRYQLLGILRRLIQQLLTAPVSFELDDMVRQCPIHAIVVLEFYQVF